MDRHIPTTLNLYDTEFGTSFPQEQYYVIIFDKIPSINFSNELYSSKIIDEVIKKSNFIEKSMVKSTRERGDTYSEKSMFVNEEKKMIIITKFKHEKEGNFVSFDILFDIEMGGFEEQLKFFKFEKYKLKIKKSNIQIITNDMGHFDVEEYDLKIPECDLKLNYGTDFLKLHKLIVKRLNTHGDKGIVLLHGDPGTGKTTYIKILSSLIKEKNILFVPPSMAEMLSDPSIIPFLMEHKDSILLIEDAEKVIGMRNGDGSQVAVSNLLNLTDGILGDCLNIQVIATFNMPKENIDPALLRKGRLICEHRFEKLSVNDTNTLLKSLNKDSVVENGLTLADIYNINFESNRITNERKPAGFQIKK